MKRKLYYTVYKEEDSEDKTVYLYEMENNEPKRIATLDLELEENSEGAIIDWMNDNDYGVEGQMLELIIL